MKEQILAQISNCTGAGCKTNLPRIAADDAQIARILSVTFGVIAAMAVLTIVVASVNITTGGGDADKIARGKRTIIFSLVGLTIALFAEAIVLTVLGKL